jgi:hypothetical protein
VNSLRDMTEAEILAKSARNRAGRGKPVGASKATLRPDSAQAAAIPEKRRGRMNKLEERYLREVLAPQAMAGAIDGYWYEGVKLRLATGAWYTPDFMTVDKRGRIQLIEVKGFWREASRVRIKVAAEMYQLFTFRAVRRVGGVWETEKF